MLAIDEYLDGLNSKPYGIESSKEHSPMVEDLPGQTRGSKVRKLDPKRSHILGRLRAIRTVISSHFTGHQAPNQGVLAP